MLISVVIGLTRHLFGLIFDLKDKHGFEGDGLKINIAGAGGECSFAKFLNVFWSPTVNTFKRGHDVVGRVAGYQVRLRSRDDWDLPLRQDDPPGIYVLMTGRMPNYHVRGWWEWPGWEEAQKTYPKDWIKTHGDRPPAYFIPQGELRPMRELPDLKKRRPLIPEE